MRDYGLAAPHGPNRTGRHVATADFGDMKTNEASVFRSLLLPDDSYDENGTYWADMKLGKRINFIRKVDNEEAKKELKSIGRMMKADPLSPVSFYFRNMVIPGMGLLLEGYDLSVNFFDDSANNCLVMCFSPSVMSSHCSKPLSRTAGTTTLFAPRLGSKLLTTSRFAESSLDKFLSVSLVTGSDVVGVLFRTPSSCFWVLSC